MLAILVLRLLSLLGVSMGAASAGPRAEVVTTPRAAQVRLVDALAEADAIVGVHVRGATVTFAIVDDERALDVVATTGPRGAVTALAILPAAVPAGDGLGLAWLAEELQSVTAITRLVPDDGAITLVTRDGRRYAVIPGRGSGGNAAVEARWAGEWDR